MIPGFSISLGITVAMLSMVVLIPFAALAVHAMKLSPAAFWKVITQDRVTSAFMVSLETSAIAALVNMITGLILAWVLVRYDFPGRKIMNGMIELPFALPTAVAGISLTSLTSENGVIGRFFGLFGIRIAYTKAGIVFALIFVGIPFVVRAVQPVLEKFDVSFEEAATVLGATRVRTFFDVILPELLPALMTGTGLAFGRGLGEYGSVVFIAGNKPYETEIAPLIIMSRLQQFDYTSACSIGLVMLLMSFLLLFLMNLIQVRNTKILRGGDV